MTHTCTIGELHLDLVDDLDRGAAERLAAEVASSLAERIEALQAEAFDEGWLRSWHVERLTARVEGRRTASQIAEALAVDLRRRLPR